MTVHEYPRSHGSLSGLSDTDHHIQYALDTQGVISARPVPGRRGRFYYATDEQTLYRDTGTSWVSVNNSSVLFDAKGDLLIGQADNVAARLPLGANGQALVVDTAQALGVKWASVKDMILSAQRLMTPGEHFSEAALLKTGTLNVGSGVTQTVVATPAAGTYRVVKSLVISNYGATANNFDLTLAGVLLCSNVPISGNSVVTINTPFLLSSPNTLTFRPGGGSVPLNITAHYYDVPDIGTVAGGLFGAINTTDTNQADTNRSLYTSPAGLSSVVTSIVFGLRSSGTARAFIIDSEATHGSHHPTLGTGAYVAIDEPYLVRPGQSLVQGIHGAGTSGVTPTAGTTVAVFGYYR